MEHTKLEQRGQNMVAIDGQDTQVGFCSYEPDARRLVACWNACDGVSVEWLEAQADPASEELFGKTAPLDKRLQAAMQDAEAAKAQRDELLAKLEALTHYAECQVAAFSGGSPYLDMTLFPGLCASSRALIAKHKEASHG